ncbi:DNA alkylation repair protein [Glaciihabitans sp. INWT7]|uniref:DNA alkylation repair protein n=1 Tax=Glaciihabitans sp. INWT7 TaxID=2596912 RepID=UPI0016283317|nr:DNA alkylation repair protein [Glaciihabitans sp. INWT7]QNE47464.1 DNA alkylation repair protein [Glaciihabitans sp. INWT7]
MSDAGGFVDAALQLEATWQRAITDEARIGSHLQFYGASVGAVRGTIRAVTLRYPGLGHDEITALASELWGGAVYERRLAAVVLLQTHVRRLDNSDLTRLEGFLREALTPALADPLIVDVIVPLFRSLDGGSRARANVAVQRWTSDENPWLRQAARHLVGID